MRQVNTQHSARIPPGQTALVAVLLVEANVETAHQVEGALLSAANGAFCIESVTSLQAALEHLMLNTVDVVLAGENLTDCVGPDVYRRLRLAAPTALMLPLNNSAVDLEKPEGSELESGHHSIDVHWLPSALNYVVQRKSTEFALRAADAALYEARERARVMLGSIADAVLVTDTHGKVTYINQVAESLTGWSASQALGQPLAKVFKITNRKSGKRARNPALYAMAKKAALELEANCILHRLDETEVGIEDSAAPIHSVSGQITGAVIVFRDVRQSVTMTRKMAWLASHDSLTGLASRVLFDERFTQVISLANRHSRRAAMLFVDLDNFKNINDKYGHKVGDHVLQSVSRYLLRGVRDSDTVCRYGGDEFVILLADVADFSSVERAAKKLMKLFTQSLVIGEYRVKVSMSIGISMYPDDGKEMLDLIECADVAMYQAKLAGKNACGFYSSSGSESVLLT